MKNEKADIRWNGIASKTHKINGSFSMQKMQLKLHVGVDPWHLSTMRAASRVPARYGRNLTTVAPIWPW